MCVTIWLIGQKVSKAFFVSVFDTAGTSICLFHCQNWHESKNIFYSLTHLLSAFSGSWFARGLRASVPVFLADVSRVCVPFLFPPVPGSVPAALPKSRCWLRVPPSGTIPVFPGMSIFVRPHLFPSAAVQTQLLRAAGSCLHCKCFCKVLLITPQLHSQQCCCQLLVIYRYWDPDAGPDVEQGALLQGAGEMWNSSTIYSYFLILFLII